MSTHSVLSQVWRASELAPVVGATVASGHAVLDAELPAAGWPLGALVELLVTQNRAPWSSLLLPGLALHVQRQEGALALLDPPFVPHVPALVAAGIPAARMLWLRSRSAADATWLAGQAAGCAGVAALLAWLPQARPAHLRRLHATARKRDHLLLFAFLDAAGPAARAPSCAPLQLALQWGEPAAQAAGPCLRVDLLRRRGPPLHEPLWLPAGNAALQALLACRAEGSGRASAADNVVLFPREKSAGHAAQQALDRLAMAD